MTRTNLPFPSTHALKAGKKSKSGNELNSAVWLSRYSFLNESNNNSLYQIPLKYDFVIFKFIIFVFYFEVLNGDIEFASLFS